MSPGKPGIVGVGVGSRTSLKAENEMHLMNSLRYWDVTLPPIRKYMIGGYLVPGVKNAFSEVSMGSLNKKRRITIELYKKIKNEKEVLLYQSRKSPQRLMDGLLASDIDAFGAAKSASTKKNDTPFSLDDDDLLIFRIFKPVSSNTRSNTEHPQNNHKHNHHGSDDDDEEKSVAVSIEGELGDQYLTTFSVENYGDGYDESNKKMIWKERFRAKLQTMEILKTNSRTIEIRMGVGEDTIVRDFSFDSIQQAENFTELFNELQRLQRERGLRQAKSHGSSSLALTSANQVESKNVLDFPVARDGVASSEKMSARSHVVDAMGYFTLWRNKKKTFPSQINLLVEIVAAYNLPIADVSSSDPYVLVQDGTTEWHRTSYIPHTLNPVWTLSTGSLFLIQTSLADFFEIANVMEFIVKDYDSIGGDEVLGSIMVSKKEMLEGTGARMEYQLIQYSGKNHVSSRGSKMPYIVLRFKVASDGEVEFMSTYESNKRKGFVKHFRNAASRVAGAYAGSHAAAQVAGDDVGSGLYAETSFLPIHVVPNPSMKRNRRPTNDGKSIQYRVKPFPDPDRYVDETKWLTHNEIDREAYKSSTKWIEAGTGSVGKFYVEIIGCDGLPNMDFSITGRDKTDAFCTLVYEDCIVNTDVIHDCLSPRWMPWSQRAFIFNILHPSSQIYIAILDYDEFIPGATTGPSGKHDKIGRVVVNPTNFRPNSVYTLRYHIFTSDDPDRELRGTLILRCRYETASERMIMFSQLQLQTQYNVSTVTKSDFRCTYYAIANDRHHQTLSLQALTRYVEEIHNYTNCLDEIADALIALFMWRGTYPINITCFNKTCSFKIPLHSMIAFAWGIILARDFEKIFSFLCFWVGWVLLAVLEFRRSNPNPWKRPRSYLELLGVLFFNLSFVRVSVAPNENIENILKYDEMLAEREHMRKEALENMRIEKEINEKRLQEEGEEMDQKDFDRTAKVGGGIAQLTLAPFKSVLLPAQLALYKICVLLRVATSIVMWDDTVAAFWVVTAAFICSLLVAWIPWAFLFRWAFKIFVYVVLGPWMKLIDIFYVHKIQNLTMEEQKAKLEEDYQRRYNLVLGETYLRKLQKERTMKLQDMTKYMFGEYLMRVPVYKEQRFHSIPLSGGSVEPYDASNAPPINIVKHVDGQFLSGEMVPKRENSQAEKERREMQMQANETDKDSQETNISHAKMCVSGELTPLLEEYAESDNISV